MHSLAMDTIPPLARNVSPTLRMLVPLSTVGSALIAMSKALKDEEFSTFTAISKPCPKDGWVNAGGDVGQRFEPVSPMQTRLLAARAGWIERESNEAERIRKHMRSICLEGLCHFMFFRRNWFYSH